MFLNCGVGEDSWESLGLQGDSTSPFWRRSALGFLWREWCWSWNSSTLATSCEELTHWKRLWCWEGLGAGGEGDDRGWDGWMASPTWWAWVWVNSGSWWWTERPGVLWFMGSQRVGHDWATELNWTETILSNWNSVACNSNFSLFRTLLAFSLIRGVSRSLSTRECLILRKPVCCFLFLKGLLFLISSWKTGMSRAVRISQGWGHEMEHIRGFLSVTFYFSVELLSHVPISNTWIVFWPCDDCYCPSYCGYALGFSVFAQLYFSA